MASQKRTADENDGDSPAVVVVVVADVDGGQRQQQQRQGEDDEQSGRTSSATTRAAAAYVDREEQGEERTLEQQHRRLSAEETASSARGEGRNGNVEDAKQIMSPADLLYGVESFQAVVGPVLTTMILSSLAVIYINTPATQAAGQQSISSSYNVYGNAEDAGDTTGQQLSAGLVNALVIVLVICGMTFVMVLLYKYRCMKILLGYLVIASAMLLGYLTSVMFQVAIERYNLGIDKITFWALIYNNAAVGTASIYFQRGFPTYVTQAYLIATSVVVAWQLSFFDPWTAWALLVLLALYDLFAVLTPCGPLKALIKLMQRDDAPDMPGLLYEASLPTGGGTATGADAGEGPIIRRNNAIASCTRRQQQQPLDGDDAVDSNDNNVTEVSSASEPPAGRDTIPAREETAGDGDVPEILVEPSKVSGAEEEPFRPESGTTVVDGTSDENEDENQDKDLDDAAAISVSVTAAVGDVSPSLPVSGDIPLAIAIAYKLPLIDDPCPDWMPSSDGGVVHNAATYSPDELRSLVHVVFPSGGIIRPSNRQKDEEPTRYDVIDTTTSGDRLQRTLFVDNEGVVMKVIRKKKKNKNTEAKFKDRSKIRLGLGDFIFYSILVSEAAVYSFATFAACALVILVGLGMTLALLAVYGKALPALPISIFLGVVAYLLARFLQLPWIQEVFLQHAYV